MADFWFVEPKGSSTMTWIEPQDLVLRSGEREWPELRWDVARGDHTALAEPLRFKVDRRGKLGDLLWSTGSAYKVASTRFVEILAEVGATGWTSMPVEITYKNGDELGGYHHLMVTGCCDDVYDIYDPLTRREEHGTIYASGLDVTEGWDGSDLFWSRGKAATSFLTSDRVLRALEGAGLTGFEFEGSTARELLIGETASDDPAEAEWRVWS